MLRVLALATFLVLLAGCGTEESQLPSQNQTSSNELMQQDAVTKKTTTEVNVQKDSVIGEMHWPDVNSYCTFFKEGHKFDFDNQDTWKFVFVTLLAGAEDVAYMQINNKREAIKLVSSNKIENTEKRIYKVDSNENIQIEIAMKAGESGVEHTNYTGVIRLLKPVEGGVIKFYGDCGV
ncbi:hypothetical protein [Spartinivicinus poritis]|uniref:Lipoprotein n=1 Tax=Spartinivicinus poritis TaxID=2994640 RepID=A0ABT5UF58_9GAMM|nr:hypothetical protein [Spartinivicinus sp. A2-2]MDE1464942.1 hypothetical protein [Spartinivicinus sp. A2-2]